MLKRFYTTIVRKRRLVLAVFALAVILSAFASRAVQVDYDMNDYLPPDSPFSRMKRIASMASIV